jgi:hypothetical protein
MSRLDDIPDTGDACFLSRYCDRKRRIRDPRILLDEIDQRTFVDIENLILVAEAMPQANLAHWKFSDFELHQPFIVQDFSVASLLRNDNPDVTGVISTEGRNLSFEHGTNHITAHS